MGASRDWILPATLIASSLTISSAGAQWKVRTASDPLDPKNSTTSVYVEATKPIQQFGHDVKVWVVIHCYFSERPMPNDKRILRPAVTLTFSEPVAIGKRQIRWRIGDHPVSSSTSDFWNDGKVYYLSWLLGKTDQVSDQLKTAETMKIDADLPWAGRSVMDFDLAGRDEAFKALPCLAGKPGKAP